MIRLALLAALIAATMGIGGQGAGARVRGDYYGYEQTPLDHEAGDMTLTLCVEGQAC